MAIDFADLSSLTDTLKTVYGEGITNQFAEEKSTYNSLPVSPRKIGGKGYVFSVSWGNPAGIGSRGESQKLPDPLVGKYDQGTITPKYVYGSIRITGPAIEAAKGNVQAFADGLSNQIDTAYSEVIVDLNRMVYGDGSGKLGTTSAITTPVADANWNMTFDNSVGVTYIRPGMLVDMFQSTTADATCCSQRVASVDFANKIAAIEGFNISNSTYRTNHPNATIAAYTATTATVAAGSLMIKLGARNADTSVTYEPVGFEAVIDDGTNVSSFEGISETTYTEWKANVLGNSSVDRELTEDLMIQACNLVRARSGKDVSVIRLGLGQLRKYFNLLAGDRRFVDTGTFSGGFQTLQFAYNGNIQMMVDPYTTPGKMYFEPKGIIQRYELRPLGFLNPSQQLWWRSGYDEFDIPLGIYTNIGAEQRSCLAKLEDLVEPAIA